MASRYWVNKVFFILLYADDIVIFSYSAEGLQNGLNYLEVYCKRWKLMVNTSKTKIMVFRKGGTLPRNLEFLFDNNILEIVSNFHVFRSSFHNRWLFCRSSKYVSWTSS